MQTINKWQGHLATLLHHTVLLSPLCWPSATPLLLRAFHSICRLLFSSVLRMHLVQSDPPYGITSHVASAGGGGEHQTPWSCQLSTPWCDLSPWLCSVGGQWWEWCSQQTPYGWSAGWWHRCWMGGWANHILNDWMPLPHLYHNVNRHALTSCPHLLLLHQWPGSCSVWVVLEPDKLTDAGPH